MDNRTSVKSRSSNIELLRIISMLVIVAHHYVVNSGLINIIKQHPFESNSLYLLMFGWGGKTAINCFLLITGYFMCKQEATLKKYLKFLLQILFWNVLIGIVFLLLGYERFSFMLIAKMLLPFNNVGNSGVFISSYLFFYLCIPFVNTMLRGINKRMHQFFLIGAIVMFSILPSIGFKTVFSSIIWFTIVYMLGAYIRLYYPETNSTQFYGYCTIVFLILSLGSIPIMLNVGNILGKFVPYFLVNEENKIFALALAVSCFIFFLKLKIESNKIINLVGSACFGVLLIHANSNAMRTWLWNDTIDCVGHYGVPWMMSYAFVSVLSIYTICTILELIRIRYIENGILNIVYNHIVRHS